MPYKERLGQRYICSRYPMRRFGNTVFSQENDVACVIEDAPVAPVAQPKPVSQPKQVQAVEKVETPPAQVGADPEKIECDATLIALAQSVSTDCPEAQRLAREIIAYCNGETKTLVQMNVYRNTLESALAVCEQNARSVRVTTSLHRSSVSAAEKISAISNKLNAITFDTTVWRDAQGNFNTSRLVSDSVAGVVLGTAGGLITSNVIKKNQIANGFEDLSCAIGGQVVAGWDDEFVVGVK